jgi:molecular chaperone GrpE
MNKHWGNDRHRSEREPAQPEELRVTDRRRIHINGDEDESAGSSPEEPRRKPTYVEELEARAHAAEQKLIEVQARFDQLRVELQRETDETRQRLNRAADERAQRQKAEFIAALLPALDNLQRAIAAAENGSPIGAVVDGLKGSVASFTGALTAAGAEPIVSVGQSFDPLLHDAVDTVPVEAEREGLVTAEYASGYKIGDRLLRPARVQVGRAHADKKAAV